jgi:hypothetical protein
MPGQENNICLHDYYYSLEEIAELFEGKLRGKIVHFQQKKVLDLSQEEAQYSILQMLKQSGYGESYTTLSSIHLTKFFSLCEEQDDLVEDSRRIASKALCIV